MPSFTQRRTLLSAAALLLAKPGVVWSHNEAGPLTPSLPVPSMPITWHDGKSSDLRAMLTGRVTAVQTMFTSCSAICPIQGALFAGLQQALSRAPEKIQLISLSIDPLGDKPSALAAWLKQFDATKRWRAGLPSIDDVDQLMDFLKARSDSADQHTGQVYLFNDQAELILRTADFPRPDLIAELLLELASKTS